MATCPPLSDEKWLGALFRIRLSAMLVVTTDTIQGYRIEAVLGEVFGVGAQPPLPPNPAQNRMPYPNREQMVRQNRDQAMRMMVYEATQWGANAVIAYSMEVFQCDQFGAGVSAIGTAVKVRPIPENEEGATPQSVADAKQKSAPPVSDNQDPSHQGSPAQEQSQPNSAVLPPSLPHTQSQPPFAPPAQPGPAFQPQQPGYGYLAQPATQQDPQQWAPPEGQGR